MSSRGFASLIDKLDALGFFEMTGRGLRGEVKARCIKDGFLFPEPPLEPLGRPWAILNVLGAHPDETGRSRGADAENLAESGPAIFFIEMAPSLHYTHDFDVTELRKEHRADGSLLITFNGDARAFYTPADRAKRDRDWYVISMRAIAMLNAALDRSGTSNPDRLYVCAAGSNDQDVVLLTPEMFAEIDGHPDVLPYERVQEVLPNVPT